MTFDPRDLDLSKNEPLKNTSGVPLYLPTKFGEDRLKDLGAGFAIESGLGLEDSGLDRFSRTRDSIQIESSPSPSLRFFSSKQKPLSMLSGGQTPWGSLGSVLKTLYYA